MAGDQVLRSLLRAVCQARALRVTRRRAREALDGLAQELLIAGGTEEVVRRTDDCLAAVLGAGQGRVRKGLAAASPDEREVAGPGAGGLTLGVAARLSAPAMAFVETTARLAGLALRRVQAEAALARAEGERAAVSSEALEAASDERGRIATRIHDEVLPHLAAATVQADNVRAAVATGEAQRVAELASKAQRTVHDGIASLREILDDLEREVVAPGRLREALEDSLERLRRTENIDTRLDAPSALPEMPFAVELLIVETVRGCLANVADTPTPARSSSRWPRTTVTSR